VVSPCTVTNSCETLRTNSWLYNWLHGSPLPGMCSLRSLGRWGAVVDELPLHEWEICPRHALHQIDAQDHLC
jgi:hypothetical protein